MTPLANNMLSILMVIFEWCSAILTTVRSVQAIRSNGTSWQEQKKGFFYLILEQGVLYFCIISLFTVTAVILNFRTTGFWQRLLNAFTLPLSGLLTARFLLHLREWESSTYVSGTKSTPGGDAERNQLSEFEVARRTANSLVDDFGEDPVMRERNRDTLPVEMPMEERSAGSRSGGSQEEVVLNLSVKEGKRRAIV
ncbi:hypothetical protein GLOTRDRAFT_129244 [Gloeophyllum trabeum ATCC 11539]|uniref:Uncharacterized protein n=1 Tax=Gloeophyllum trabeum (strain ATCC 11539 / FP-39264 / Madison 617) TaxID=670483 RepID=S7Q7R4_GLOTA|nr:uncharacterized protein GLOTRDRAFT_129244 [Gloeophyllum trabeum ATCC 11539]EPQ56041.1 hypothetical protein GLOTRDRAFT_129244 [Gloeophyllum trabeum ATCC 11539]